MTDQLRPVTRALLSVSDKTGLIEFARALAGHGVELVSTGGTAKAIADAGLKVRDVSELTGFPEMMDGRVKTLHPKVHGGLLAIRDNAEHQKAASAHGIAPIDLLVVNLYPFEQTVEKGASEEDCIENIDIGGPAMIRAAAKNHNDVAVVVEADDYAPLLAELAANKGATTLGLRRKLAALPAAERPARLKAMLAWYKGLSEALDQDGVSRDYQWNVDQWTCLIDTGRIDDEQVELLHLTFLRSRTATGNSGRWQALTFSRRAKIILGTGSVSGVRDGGCLP